MLQHPNIVKLIGTCSQPKMCMVLEYVELGGLDKVLRKTSSLSWKLVMHFLLDIAKGMQYLHHCNVINRDLKSSNLLVASMREDAQVNLKITDFGT